MTDLTDESARFDYAPPVPDIELRNEVARRFADLDARDWGYDHGFVATYGTDPETDAFVDAVADLVQQARIELSEARHDVEQLEERVAEQHEINQGWFAYGQRVKSERAELGDKLIDALGITEPVGRHFEVLVPQACAELEHQRASRQDWAAEAARLDHLRALLAEAAQLPVDVSDDALLAEVRARFDGVVRAAVGHGFVVGSPECECGAVMPTRLDWMDHVEALRAEGVPTATIAAGGDR